MRKISLLIIKVLFTAIGISCKRDMETMSENFRKQGDSRIEALFYDVKECKCSDCIQIDSTMSNFPCRMWFLSQIAKTKNGKVFYDIVDINGGFHHYALFTSTYYYQKYGSPFFPSPFAYTIEIQESINAQRIRKAHSSANQSKAFFVKDKLLYILIPSSANEYNVLIYNYCL